MNIWVQKIFTRDTYTSITFLFVCAWLGSENMYEFVVDRNKSHDIGYKLHIYGWQLPDRTKIEFKWNSDFFLICFIFFIRIYIYRVTHTLCMSGNRAFYTNSRFVSYQMLMHHFVIIQKKASDQLRIDLCVFQIYF